MQKLKQARIIQRVLGYRPIKILFNLYLSGRLVK